MVIEYRSFVATCDIQSLMASGLIGQDVGVGTELDGGKRVWNCVCTAARQNTNAVLTLAAEESFRDNPSPRRVRIPGQATKYREVSQIMQDT